MAGYNTTSDLTDDEAAYIEAQIIEGHTEVVVGRQIFETIPVPAGKVEYTFNTLTEMSEAGEIPELSPFPMDTVDRTPTTIYIKKLGKAYGISREAILAAREGGYPVQALSARSVGKQIAEKEEYNIWNGVSTALTSASISTLTPASGIAWDAPGATYENDVVDMMRQFSALNSDDKWFQMSDIVLEPEFYWKLFTTNTYGLRPIEGIRKLGIEVHMAHLNGIAGIGVNGFAFDREYLKLIEAEPITTEGKYVQENQSYVDQAFERVGVAVLDANAFRKLNLETL